MFGLGVLCTAGWLGNAHTTADNVLCSACKVYLPYGGYHQCKSVDTHLCTRVGATSACGDAEMGRLALHGITGGGGVGPVPLTYPI